MNGPTVAEERLMELRARGIATPPVPWRSNGPLLSLVFFFLTCAATAASWAFIEMILDAEKLTSWVVAIVAIALAEALIRGSRFFGTGVESALWLAGLFCAIFGLPGQGSTEVLLVFALASVIAGVRVRNPFFGALAATFVISYLDAKNLNAVAAGVAIASAAASLAALGREWQRPSTEMLWRALVVIPPIVAAMATMNALPWWWAAVYALFAAVSLVAGMRLRRHTAFIAAAVNVVIAVSTLAYHKLLPFEEEWQLMIGGAALLALSAIVARGLRDRTTGVVVTQDALTTFDDELQMLGTIAAQPHVEVADADRGGRFGGAGATGDY